MKSKASSSRAATPSRPSATAESSNRSTRAATTTRCLGTRSARTEVRAVAPDANPYLVMLSVFKTGLDGTIAKIDNLRQAHRYLPDNIYSAIDLWRGSDWIGKLLGD